MTPRKSGDPGRGKAKPRSRAKTARKASRPRKSVIGWKEWVRFPDLGVEGIRTKVDTGARTSALHAIDLCEAESNGKPVIRFKVECELDPSKEEVEVELPLVDKRPVRDSSGNEELRPVVQTAVELHEQRWEIELSLTRRDDMEFNMLLGRRAISGRFVVDPDRAYVAGSPGPDRTDEEDS